MSSKNMMFVRLDCEPFKSRAIEYREARKVAIEAWVDFRVRVGARNARPPCLFEFTSAPDRKNWVKSGNRRTDWYRPRQGTEIDKEVATLPPLPKTWDIFGDVLMTDYAYERVDGSGSRRSRARREGCLTMPPPPLNPLGDVLARGGMGADLRGEE